MTVCPECHKQIDEDDTFCKHCGANLADREWNAKEVLHYYGSF